MYICTFVNTHVFPLIISFHFANSSHTALRFGLSFHAHFTSCFHSCVSAKCFAISLKAVRWTPGEAPCGFRDLLLIFTTTGGLQRATLLSAAERVRCAGADPSEWTSCDRLNAMRLYRSHEQRAEIAKWPVGSSASGADGALGVL